eukprot:366223-Chlamydomonas_euryale.AAC.13
MAWDAPKQQLKCIPSVGGLCNLYTDCTGNCHSSCRFVSAIVGRLESCFGGSTAPSEDPIRASVFVFASEAVAALDKSIFMHSACQGVRKGKEGTKGLPVGCQWADNRSCMASGAATFSACAAVCLPNAFRMQHVANMARPRTLCQWLRNIKQLPLILEQRLSFRCTQPNLQHDLIAVRCSMHSFMAHAHSAGGWPSICRLEAGTQTGKKIVTPVAAAAAAPQDTRLIHPGDWRPRYISRRGSGDWRASRPPCA